MARKPRYLTEHEPKESKCMTCEYRGIEKPKDPAKRFCCKSLEYVTTESMTYCEDWCIRDFAYDEWLKQRKG